MKMIRVSAVAEKIGSSGVDVWRKAKNDPTFPKPVRISPNVTCWVESEIDSWIEQRIASYRANPAKREGAQVAAKVSAQKRAERKAQEASHAPT